MEYAGLDLFISLLLKYPEFNAVKYDTSRGLLRIDVALQGEVTVIRRDEFIHKAETSLSLYHHLSKVQPEHLLFDFQEQMRSKLTLLQYHRDMASLQEGEIEVFAGILQHTFAGQIIKDTGKIILEEDFKKQVKRNLMQKIKRNNARVHDFVAYREDGRVFVFNK